MISGNVDSLMKQTFLYSYILSQPFTVYVDAYPEIEHRILLETSHLQYGEHNKTVRILQKKLKDFDLYQEEIDGYYGVYTEYALKQLQMEYGMTATGEANEATIKLVVKTDLDKKLERLEALPAEIDTSNKSDHIILIQEILADLGYYTGEIDGIYGPLTEEAIHVADRTYDLHLADKLTKEEIKMIVKEEKKEIEKKEVVSEKNNDIKTISRTESFIQSAKSLIGSPYQWGGTSPSGFDCSGFIQFLYSEQDMTIPRTVSDIWNFSTPVDSPSVGDLVFFETYQAGPSHVGVYIGNDTFIHAGLSNGVEQANLNEPYWKSRYLGSKRIP